MRRLLFLFVILHLLSQPGRTAPFKEEQRVLATARVGTSGPALLEFLRKRAAAAKVESKEVQTLIRQLGDSEAEADRAQAELIAHGSSALALLREAQKGAGSNKAKPRIDECLRCIEGADASLLMRAVINRLTTLRPNGTVAALLSFVARGDDEAIDDARQALVTLAVREGKVDPVLEESALKDALVQRRLIAVEILCQAEAAEVVRKLLRDPSLEVRLHAASLRLDQGDIDAVPVLIELLTTLPKGPRAALDPLERLAGPLSPKAGNPKETQDAWANWWRNIDSDSVTKYLKERTPTIDANQIGELIELLGSKSYRVRNKAEKDLISLRGLSIPWLEKAARNSDLEIRRRAERCLSEIQTAPDAAKSAAQVRLMTLRRPAETAKLLMAYVAFADAEAVVDEVRQSFRVLARREPATLAILKAALADRAPQRRAVAAEVLAEVAGEEIQPALRKLLNDTEPAVRLKVALALAARQDRTAVPVLIDLLTTLPVEQCWTIEDMLRRVAGEKGPSVYLGSDEIIRKKCRDAWAVWWKDNGDRADLTVLRDRPSELGLTLVSLWPGSNESSIVELGRDQKERWRIDKMGYVFDFVVLPGNRLLIVENTLNKVTERNFKGEVLWQFDIPGPINCQRLPNGHVFIAANNEAVIVDRDKKVVQKFPAESGLMGGQRYRDGKVALLSSSKVQVFDAEAKLIRSWQLEGGMSNYGGIQETSNGHLLIAQHHRNKVSEYDLEGKLMWSCESQSPNFATRLRNGHTLIGSQDRKTLVEMDRNGKQVSEYNPGVSVWRSRRR